MKNIKKLFVVLMALLCLVMPISADEISNSENSYDTFVKSTNEPMMPLERNNLTLSSLNFDARKIWVDQVTKINEETYNQKIESIEENENYYIFSFAENKELVNKTVTINGENYVNVQIDKILYLKPESRLMDSYNSSINRVAAGSTKIVEYYAWSDGYLKYKDRSGILKSIADLAIGYVPTKSKLVSWVLGQAFGYLYDTFKDSTYVKAETYNKYYFRNKVGCVYHNVSGWVPTAQVGERRSFGWSWGSYKNKDGEPMILEKGPVKNANYSKNPTNYDSREKKPHYDDNAWIMNKAKEAQSTGGYWDCFGIAYTPAN